MRREPAWARRVPVEPGLQRDPHRARGAARGGRARGKSAIGRPWSLLLLAGLIPLGGCGAGDGPAASGPPPPAPVWVELYEVTPQAVRDEIALTGELAAEDTVVLKSEIAGVVKTVEFEEGQPVKHGDVLFELDDREWRARLMEAEADQRLAQDVFQRTQTLTSRDVSSLARSEEAAANLDKAKARTELARLQLDRTRIRAPFDGVVGMRMVVPGSRVEDDVPLVEIVAIDRLQALFTVQEQGVPLAKVDLPVQVRVAAYPKERFPGKVFFVAPSLDSAARRLILKAWIDNPDHRLKPGMFVNVDVEIARNEAALMVPESAIIYDRHGIFVWRSGPEGKAEKVPVELGLRQEGRVEISSGVAPGDVIVSAGTHKVLAGDVIRDPRSTDGAAFHAHGSGTVAEKDGAS